MSILEKLKANSTHVIIMGSTLSLLLIPIGLEYLKLTSLFESIMIGVFIVLVPNVLYIYQKSSAIGTIQNKVDTIKENVDAIQKNVNMTQENVNTIQKTTDDLSSTLKIRNMANQELSKVDTTYKKLTEMKNDFFNKVYLTKFTDLKGNLEKTIHDQSMPFSVTDIQDNATIKTKIHEYCATCMCKGITWWLEDPGKIFINFIHKNIIKPKESKPGIVKRIFIYSEADEAKELKGSLVRMAFYLHRFTSGYSFKVVNEKKFNEMLRVQKDTDSTMSKDFGIFKGSDKFEFVWETTMDDDMYDVETGTLIMNKAKVTRYNKFFDDLWAIGQDYEDIEQRYPIADNEKIRTACTNKTFADFADCKKSLLDKNSTKSKQSTKTS